MAFGDVPDDPVCSALLRDLQQPTLRRDSRALRTLTPYVDTTPFVDGR